MSLKALALQKGIKIFGIAANYPSNTMKQKTKEPIIFSKTLNSLSINQKQTHLRALTSINYEIELGVEMGSNNQIQSYFLALDLTSSEIPQYRKDGKSFTLTKSLDNYLPVSEEICAKDLNWDQFQLQLFVNDKLLISGFTKDMFYTLQDQIQFIDKHIPLHQGDLLLSGTPGIEPLNHNDMVDARLIYGNQIKARIQTQMKIDEYISKL